MRIREKIKGLNRLEKLGLVALTLALLYTLIGFLVIPQGFKLLLANHLSKNLNLEVAIQSVRVNPYVLSVSVRGLTAREQNSPSTFASFDELYLNIQAVSIIKGGLVVKEMTLTHPYLELIRTAPHRYNFSDLLEGRTSTLIKHFSINNLEVNNGEIRIEDVPEHATHLVNDLALAIPFISNMQADVDVWVKPRFSALINGSSFTFAGETKPFSNTRETDLDIKLQDFNLSKYLEYVPVKLLFGLRSGLLDLNLKFVYQQLPAGPFMNLSGDIALKRLDAVDANGTPILSLPKLDARIDSFRPLEKQLHISKILFSPFELNAWRNKEGTFNLQTLIGKEEGTQPPPRSADGETRYNLVLDSLELQGGKIAFADYARQAPFKTDFEAVNLTIAHFSNAPGAKANLAFSTRTDAAQLSLAGDFSIEPIAAAGNVKLTGLGLPKFAPYYRDLILFDIEDANLSFGTDYRLSTAQDQTEMVLANLSASVASVRFRKRGEPKDFLKIASLSLQGGEFDLQKRNLTVQKLTSSGGTVSVIRLANGGINLANLLPPRPAAAAPSNPNKVLPGLWNVALIAGELSDYSIAAEDRSAPEPVKMKLDQIALQVNRLSNFENSRGRISLSFRVDEKGKTAINGDVGVKPYFGDLRLDFENIGITPAEPYIRRLLRARLTGGTLSLKGNLLLGESPEKKLGVSYLGDVSLTDLATVSAGKDLIKWKTLAINGIDYGNNPAHISVQGVAFDDYFVLIRISPDGTINLLDILNTQEEGKRPPEAGEQQAPPSGGKEGGRGEGGEPGGQSFGPVRIRKCVLRKGRIDFSDDHIQPNFKADLSDIGGSIVGLSTEAGTEAEIDLHGKMNDVAPLDIKGKASPLGRTFRTDMAVTLSGMDMVAISPYASKYIGYTIDKGNLSLDLKYEIVRKKLESHNRFVLDQLDLGQKVESSEAVSIPVTLAIRLLKDREGRINLDIPVSGDLGNPEFHLGKVILDAVRELVSKAITSPFAFLASVIGWHGTELSYVEFPYGSSEITKDSAAKLDKLAEALYERPRLDLNVEGYVDMNQDRQALRTDFFTRLLKEQKLKEMVKSGQAGVPLDQVKIGPDEYDRCLRMAYEAQLAREQPQQRDPPDVTRQQMESYLLSKAGATDDDLRALAQSRAVKVRQYILEQKKLEPNRIFIVTPKSLSAEEKKGVKASRAVMGLR